MNRSFETRIIGYPESPRPREYLYDAVFVFGGGLHRSQMGNFYPADYRHSDDFGMLGGGIKIAAAVEMYLSGLARTFVFTGGKSEKNKSKFGDDVPSEADVYRDKFLRVLGLLRKSKDYKGRFNELEVPIIITEDKPENTSREIRHVMQAEQENGWRRVAVVSNDYHLQRVNALYEHWKMKLQTDANIEFISAENVVKKAHQGKDGEQGRYDEIIVRFYNSEQANKRKFWEEGGVEKINRGIYHHGEYQLRDK